MSIHMSIPTPIQTVTITIIIAITIINRTQLQKSITTLNQKHRISNQNQNINQSLRVNSDHRKS